MDEAVMRHARGGRGGQAGQAAHAGRAGLQLRTVLRLRTLHTLLALLSATAACTLPAQAQALPDPTRPPAFLQRGGRVPASESAAAPALPRLQSILIARHPGGRHVAVIDGHTLRPGDKFKGAVLTSVSESEAVLQRGQQRQVLKLFPATPTR